MEATSRLEGIPVNELKVVVMTGPNELRGTWVHEDVALELARWLSHEFGAYMRRVFRRYIRGEITTEESQGVKAAYDALLKDGQIKYEQVQKRLAATENALALEQKEKLAQAQRLHKKVHDATVSRDKAKAEVAKIQEEGHQEEPGRGQV